jgi:SecD/SecF fusion protein
MPFDLNLPLLAAEAGTAEKALLFLGALLGVIVLPFVLGSVIAKSVKMRDYGWKIGLTLCTLACALFILSRSFDWETKKFKIPLGVDLKGGVILIYEVENTAVMSEKGAQDSEDSINMGDLVQALTNRINPSGTKEIVIRPYGDRQVEIIIPEVDPIEVERIKRLIDTAGALEFRIVANQRDHQYLLAAAEAQSEDQARKLSRRVLVDGKPAGFWARAAKEKLSMAEVSDNILRNARTGAMIDIRQLPPMRDGEQLLQDFLEANELDDMDVLVATDDGVNVSGDNLGTVSAGNDELLNPCVRFRMKGEGVQKFRYLTSENLPSTDSTPAFYRHLGIILDERLLTFPRILTTISDNGQITGNFTQEEVDFLVGILRSGRLPATLQKVPISENQIGSMLGDDTIIKGKRAIGISLVAVLFFVLVYYRFSGFVACLALLTNLLLILALMVMLNAPLTLPGLAGLVLTVGMSVDANVLIFERIREELARGAALRMAIRNGFSKATTTIVDANLTTLITAIVLYAIGTDQIRGFAVTLILGILMSMYTAIFCSRIIFDIAERRRWIKELKMMAIVGATHFDFLGKRTIALVTSSLLIIVGLIAVAQRGQDIFDIDFTGGTSVTMVLKESMGADEVRSRISDKFSAMEPTPQFSVNTVSVEDRADSSVFKIDADVENVDDLESYIADAFKGPSGDSLLLAYSMDFADVRQVQVAAPKPSSDEKEKASAATVGEDAKAETPTAEKDATSDADKSADDPEKAEQSGKEQAEPAKAEPAKTEPAKTEPAKTEPAKTEPAKTEPAKETGEPAKEQSPPETGKKLTDDSTSMRADLPSDNVLALVAVPQDEGDEKSDAGTTESQPATDPPPTSTDEPAKPDSGVDTLEDENAKTAVPAIEEFRTVAKLSFGEKINAPTLIEAINGASRELDRPVADVVVDVDDNFDWDQESAVTNLEWNVGMVANQDDATAVLQYMKTKLASTPVWPSSSKIGGKVAGDTRSLAIAALLTSLLGIVGYIWIRFQRVVFGVAAVIALVHDVLITLGAIAISAWLAGPLGFLQIEHFKISLPVVAAFLTIIGYSLNDTIVVFDRIREVRGKSPDLTAEMINTSINQTLSRTLLTSLTTLIVVLILYALGGQGIHGFAFALVVGVLVGTYSSIFVASPTLLWMFGRSKALGTPGTSKPQ